MRSSSIHSECMNLVYWRRKNDIGQANSFPSERCTSFLLANVQHLLQVMTLTGTGDLILHQGSLRIQPPAPGSSSALQNAAWMNKTPPEAVVISGGSLGVVGGGAHISSTRTKSSALAISVGPETGERDQSPTIEEDGIFRYVGVALSVNVKETSSHDTGEMNATTPAEAHDSFSLMELSVGGADESRSGGDLQGWQEAREKKVLMSVRGDGRVMMAGGGGVLLSAGDLEVSKGDVLIKVHGHYNLSKGSVVLTITYEAKTCCTPDAHTISFLRTSAQTRQKHPGVVQNRINTHTHHAERRIHRTAKQRGTPSLACFGTLFGAIRDPAALRRKSTQYWLR